LFFVRSASGNDLAKVSALLGRSWHATYNALYGADKVAEITGAWHTVAKLKAQLTRPDSEFVVADDGKVLGGMAYAAMDRDEKDVAILHQLYVDPDHVGHGIGRDLFAEVETCFPNAKRMRLEVDPNNARAVAFYEGLGFAEIGWTKTLGLEKSGPANFDISAKILEKTLSF